MAASPLTLALNAGSSSLKLAVFDVSQHCLVRAQAERIGESGAFLLIDGRPVRQKMANHSLALRALARQVLVGMSFGRVAHRVVHGGRNFVKPTLLSSNVLRQLDLLSPYAPLHNPINLAVARSAQKLWPRARHYGVFDTAAFQALPEAAKTYALPYDWYAKYGVQKYGFHGISHQAAAATAAQQLKKPLRNLRLLTVHLGSGCSVTLWQSGKPQETSMGFSPLSGLVMRTRPGDLDPAILWFARKELHLSERELERVLWEKSGLFGLSGFSDMREILAAAGEKVMGFRPTRRPTPEQRLRSRFALGRFVHVLRLYIGAYAGLAGALDAIVYTGGIGERSPAVRRLVGRGFAPLRGVRTLVVPADEERAMIQQLR